MISVSAAAVESTVEHTSRESQHGETSLLFNSQKHIDELKSGIDASPVHNSELFTFMLKHKHFDLAHGEMLLVEKVENGYNTSVKKLAELGHDVSPCMWMYDGSWKAFSYCGSHLGCTKTPDVPEGDYNLGMRWLNSGGSESTNEEERTQTVRPLSLQEDNAESITTMVNWNGDYSKCEKTVCKKTDTGSHKRRGHVFVP